LDSNEVRCGISVDLRKDTAEIYRDEGCKGGKQGKRKSGEGAEMDKWDSGVICK